MHVSWLLTPILRLCMSPPPQFSDNGGCGYVLKPDFMLRPSAVLPAREKKALTITIYSAYKNQGRNLFCYRDDIFVRVSG